MDLLTLTIMAAHEPLRGVAMFSAAGYLGGERHAECLLALLRSREASSTYRYMLNHLAEYRELHHPMQCLDCKGMTE